MGNKISKFSDDDLGPCMQALNEKQRDYVRMFVAYGDPLDAARASGYGGEHPQSVRNAAWKLAHDPRIKAALREYAEAHLSGLVPLATTALENILLNPAHTSHFKAVERILNQAGMVIAQKHEVDVVDNRTADELKSYVMSIANAHGLDVKKILGYDPVSKALPAPKIIDAITRPVREEWEDDDE